MLLEDCLINQKKVAMKKTIYDVLLENFIKNGMEVEEGSWVETVGYKKPTTEYWFDVILRYDDKKFSLHYYFKNNKNNIHYFKMYETIIEMVEREVSTREII